jgi:hypothetical protein
VNRIAENPFYVLEVRPDASAMEVERAGQRLLAMLGVGLEAARAYRTPAGDRPRDAELVRRALDELRNPDKRWMHEIWARLPAEPVPPAADPPEAWPEALEALGYTTRR